MLHRSKCIKVCALVQGETNCELFDAKHESHLLHHDGQLSYDPKPYGVDHACRFHIKTMQVSSAFLCLKSCIGLLFSNCRSPIRCCSCLDLPTAHIVQFILMGACNNHSCKQAQPLMPSTNATQCFNYLRGGTCTIT